MQASFKFRIIAVICLSAVSLQAAIKYAVTDLGDLEKTTLGGTLSNAFAINNAGQVVGSSYTGVDQLTGHAIYARPFLYSDGKMVQLPLPDAGSISDAGATGINASGQIIINAQGPAGIVGILYTNGVSSVLNSIGQPFEAEAINASGEIAGEFHVSGTNTHMFTYQNGTMTDTGIVLHGDSVGGINSIGQIIGGGNPTFGTFLYNGGTLLSIPADGAFGINDSGQIVGTGLNEHGFLYQNGSITDLGTLGGAGSQAFGINASGQIIGESSDGVHSSSRAFIYENGVMTDLNSVIDPSSRWDLYQANAINDSGQIVGFGLVSTTGIGQGHAFLLTPIPDPSALPLLLFPTTLLLRPSRASQF